MTDLLQRRIVPFQGDELIAVQQSDGAIFVLFTRLCENLGLARRSQVLRVQRHTILVKGLVTLTVSTQGGPQDAQCLRLDLVPLWLSGLQASRVKPELQQKLVEYQQNAAVVLWQAFKPQLVDEEATSIGAMDRTVYELQQIAAMGRAITHMAEQQIELQRQQTQLSQRLDGAARIIQDVQTKISAVHIRLGVLEDQLHPGAYITEAQAGEISSRVKSLGELLTAYQPSKNHYQSIFAELYRRFGVSSYKTVSQSQYAPVLQFLEDWRTAATPSLGAPPA
ncbi:MAG: hypothetical protein NVS2B7_06250 [Herpetosiphon sp.]